MNKRLLIDTILFDVSPQKINESMTENGGRLIVQGILQRAEARNQNQRVYPKEILIREASKYLENQIKERRALGELDHPDSTVVNLQNVSHNISDIWWNGNDLYGKVEVLGTPAGNILKELFKSGIKLGISSRGMGSVEEISESGSDTVEVQDDFQLIAWDFVSEPSTQGAWMHPLKEGVDRAKQSIHNPKYDKINNIIREILCESGDFCPCEVTGK